MHGAQAWVHVLCDDRPTTGTLGPGAGEEFATVVLARVAVAGWQ
ncbi:hypothetical protein [Streptomyces sp. NPDC051569]